MIITIGRYQFGPDGWVEIGWFVVGEPQNFLSGHHGPEDAVSCSRPPPDLIEVVETRWMRTA